MTQQCPFCRPAAERLFFVSADVIGLWDAFPASPGHALLIPKRHVSNWFDATPQEQQAVVAAITTAKNEIAARFSPDGFNIGINVDEAAGQTIFHLHIHVIPRYIGDVADPRGGVRGVIPARQKYGAACDDISDGVKLIHGSEEEPLLPHIERQIASADAVDVAVAFTLRRGVELLLPHFEEFLARGGRLRYLTGDYRDATEPEALTALLDLTGAPDLRVFETAAPGGSGAFDRAFHPKAYIFSRKDGSGTAFIGSSNVSDSALRRGVEWNYRVSSAADPAGFAEVGSKFERLFTSAPVKPLTDEWIDAYARRRSPHITAGPDVAPAEVEAEPIDMPAPHEVQVEALRALEATREAGNVSGLVVLATGLGKTWLSAFDSAAFQRVLFVAHREEILRQAKHTFRRVRPHARLGFYNGEERTAGADVLFASIQTLGKNSHLDRFRRDEFDYIVVDEFHHASAATYRRLIDYFQPKFLLGLTATPERTDGGNLLALCGENLVYRCDLPEGIRRGLLSPFHYFGVPDDVDYANIPWRSGRFDEEELTAAVATTRRAENAMEQWWLRGEAPTIAFCVSTRHADFMADFFNAAGVRSVAVHSGANSAPRALSLERLERRELDIVCAVDMFNEGVDLPSLATVLMLRPTESRIVFLQQLGRGLRKAEGKSHLNVIDYIGNHRAFLLKPQTLFDLQPGRQEVLAFLDKYSEGSLSLPEGCEVTYDLEAIDILRSLVQPVRGEIGALRRYYEDFRDLNGERPTASEVFHDGYNPRAVRPDFGSWLGFVRSMGDLAPEQVAAFEQHREWFAALDTTDMSKSYKMVVLLAMLNEDVLPGEIAVERLAAGVERVSSRSAELRADFARWLDSRSGLVRMLETNPIEAWTGGRGTGGVQHFGYEDGVFRFKSRVEEAHRSAFQQLVRELVEWRLAEYLNRMRKPADDAGVVCKVSHSSGKPIIFIDRVKHPDLPVGTATVTVDGVEYLFDFVKVAVNVARRDPDGENELPRILRGWFGHDAGLPGTRNSVVFRSSGGKWQLVPEGRRASGLQLWRAYAREQIPPLYGMQFSTAVWNVGYVARSGHIFLLVTLDKSGHSSEFRYGDRFLDPLTFEWQSQNRTSRDATDGQLIKNHVDRDVPVHLFVRRAKKIGPRSAPFIYCGDVQFASWWGDRPVTVQWRLPEAVPEKLRDLLGVPQPAKSSAAALPFRVVEGSPSDRFSTCVPLISLTAAAGGFSSEQSDVESFADRAESWITWDNHRPFASGMFVARIEGHSMEPEVPAGSYVLFRQPSAGSREGRRVLVRHAGVENPDTGGSYSLKVYSSEKIVTEDGFEHVQIRLKSLNPAYPPIVLTPGDEGDVRVVGEMYEVL